MIEGFDLWLKVLGRPQRNMLPASPEEGQGLAGTRHCCIQHLRLQASHGRELRVKGGAQCTCEEMGEITAQEMQQLPGLGWLSSPQIKMD